MLLGFLPSIGPWEMAVIAMVGVLLFGKRLPEVGRNLGKGLVEFKKGLAGVEQSITAEPSPARDTNASRTDESAPKFASS